MSEIYFDVELNIMRAGVTCIRIVVEQISLSTFSHFIARIIKHFGIYNSFMKYSLRNIL